MIRDAAFDEMTKPIIDIYDQIEWEILLDIAERFKTYRNIGGSLEWYLKKLEEMGALTNQNIKVIANLSGQSEKLIRQALEKANFANINEAWVDKGYKAGYATVDYQSLLKSPSMAQVFNESWKSTKETFSLINTKVLEGAKQAYMNILNKAYITTMSGVKSYDQAITEALDELAINGITAATYKRKDGTLVNYSIEAVVRRDTLTAVIQTANKGNLTALDEIGCEYVEVSSHLGARTGDGGEDYTNHSWWQGKAYKINGEAPGYPNLYDVTGYGEIQGLSGINCRHRMFGYWPGDKLGATQYDLEENAEYYANTQKQRALERKVREARRKEAVALTPEEAEKAATNRKAAVKNLEDFVNSNGLRRDYSRETIQKADNRTQYDLDSGTLDVTDEFIKRDILNKGVVTFEDGYDTTTNQHAKDVMTANWVKHTFGGDIKLINEDRKREKLNPDSIWHDRFWEYKNATTFNSINKQLQKGANQIAENPGGVILDISKSESSLKEVIDYISNRTNTRMTSGSIVIIKNGRKVVIVIKKK